jgi:hypothetical protein
MNNHFFQDKITAIGNEMVNCQKRCEGIALERSSGILPRCLFFEANDLSKRGCAIVGLNPGESRERERGFYLKRGQTYRQTVAFWEQHKSKIRYYNRLKKLIQTLGLTGPVLWSELVKCENMPPYKRPPIRTISICTRNFLARELEDIPSKWPLISVGRDSFNILSFLNPEHAILGVPHPNGSYGHFDQILKLPLGNLLNDLLDQKTGKSLWLGAHKLPYFV